MAFQSIMNETPQFRYIFEFCYDIFIEAHHIKNLQINSFQLLKVNFAFLFCTLFLRLFSVHISRIEQVVPIYNPLYNFISHKHVSASLQQAV